jgi:hypothetical protein
MKHLQIYLISIAILVSGCKLKERVDEKTVDNNKPTVNVVYTESLTKVYDEAKKIPQEDRDFAIKQFSGMGLYIKNSNIESNLKIEKLVTNFQKDYGVSRDKNLNFSNALETYFKEQGTNKTLKFDSQEIRDNYSKIFINVSEAIRKADIDKSKEKT